MCLGGKHKSILQRNVIAKKCYKGRRVYVLISFFNSYSQTYEYCLAAFRSKQQDLAFGSLSIKIFIFGITSILSLFKSEWLLLCSHFLSSYLPLSAILLPVLVYFSGLFSSLISMFSYQNAKNKSHLLSTSISIKPQFGFFL